MIPAIALLSLFLTSGLLLLGVITGIEKAFPKWSARQRCGDPPLLERLRPHADPKTRWAHTSGRGVPGRPPERRPQSGEPAVAGERVERRE